MKEIITLTFVLGFEILNDENKRTHSAVEQDENPLDGLSDVHNIKRSIFYQLIKFKEKEKEEEYKNTCSIPNSSP